MAEIVRRRSWGGVLPLGRHVSISGSSLIQCASVSIALSSFQDGQNAIPVRRFKVEQALVCVVFQARSYHSLPCDELITGFRAGGRGGSRAPKGNSHGRAPLRTE